MKSQNLCIFSKRLIKADKKARTGEHNKTANHQEESSEAQQDPRKKKRHPILYQNNTDKTSHLKK